MSHILLALLVALHQVQNQVVVLLVALHQVHLAALQAVQVKVFLPAVVQVLKAVQVAAIQYH